jgi:hypothetical protein
MGLNEKFFRSADEDEGFFNTVIWNGNAGSSRDITGVGFVPDLVWIKKRANDTKSHRLCDVVRGAGKILYSDNGLIEASPTNEINGFIDDGFNIGNASAVNDGASGDKYVAWCWKAGGAEVFNGDGDEDSYVSANVANGFSIVKGDSTATGSDVKTVGHGLDSAPELVIMKNINNTDNWFVYSSTTGVSKFLWLNTSAGTGTWHTNMVVNSTEVGMRTQSTGTWSNMIAYCFHSVAGVSKVGTYTGDTTSVVVPTGFEPAFVMIKWVSGSIGYGSWRIYDNKRDTSSPNTKSLAPNTTATEFDHTSYAITMTGTGFTVGSAQNDSTNYNNNEYIYYAVAVTP